MPSETTADMIRDAVERTGLTQTECARRLGVTQPRLSKWCCGVVPRNLDGILDRIDEIGKRERRNRRRSTAAGRGQ